MRFVPDLIPEKYRVLKDYFKGTPYESSKPNIGATTLSWFFGILFFLWAIGSFVHPLLSMLFGVLGFIITPMGHKFISNTLKFTLTNKIKAVFCSVLILFIIPVDIHYSGIDNEKEFVRKQKEEKEKTEQELLSAKEAKLERERSDSLDFHFSRGNKLVEENKVEEATKELNYALKFAIAQSPESEKINKALNSIEAQKTLTLVKTGKYQKAIPALDELILHDRNNPSLFYNRALCLSKVGKTKEAVDDCRTAMQFGNADAEKLHDKINPIRKIVVGYVIRCCDGTESYSTSRRGTCSHHGGVCNWNEPVYEEHRKYE